MTVAASTVIEPPAQLLTAADRCDVCGSRAWVRATLASGPLHFCAHHARGHVEALRRTAIEIVDERHLLIAEENAF
ncbi:DUF7455 domain-containing protein [Schaalia suimastitidis]|uniref:DUF7455 domain-containing protein n=1 Tax=Schaalia suimastitidis TaxID=121163 RepID=UPI0004243BF0|nr:hypothetical protein [Schaalia suimastitidis]